MLEIKLKNTYKKLIHYFSIFTIILGTTFGTMNSANAADVTANGVAIINANLADTSNLKLTDDETVVLSADDTLADIDTLLADATLDISGAILTVTGAVTAADGTDLAITVNTGNGLKVGGAILADDPAADSLISIILESSSTLELTTDGDDDILTTINGDSDGNGTLTISGDTKDMMGVIGGVNHLGLITVAGDTTQFEATSTVNTTTLTITGASTSFLGAVGADTINLGAGTTTFDALITNEAGTGNAAVVLDDGLGQNIMDLGKAGTFKMDVTVQADSEGEINTTIDAVVIDGTIGTSTALIADLDLDGNTTINGNFFADLTHVANGKTLTAKANNGSTLITLDDATAGVTFSGTSAQTSKTIDGDAAFLGVITASNAAGVTFSTEIGATNGIDKLVIDGVDLPEVIVSLDGNKIGEIDMDTDATLRLAKTITNGQTVFSMSTDMEDTDVATGSKIYMPVNLSNGQTLKLFETVTQDADFTTALNLALQDTALIDYTAAITDGDDYTVTATKKTAEATATALSITKNKSIALNEAYTAAISDANADSDAEDAFKNALNQDGGFSATEDTALAKQVAPQDDMISGSTLASKAVTGTVQGIISNRMASLRSGDAYYGMGMSAGNMTAKSGFIQAFGSEVEQKNKTVGSGTQYGYESSSAGIALGFDGTTDTGATIGLSFSMSNTDLDGKGTGKAKNDIDSYTASLYWDKTGQNGYVEGSLTYGLNENKTSRLVNTAGLSRTYTGSYDSNQVSLSLGGGAPNAVGASGYVTPFIGVTGTHIKTDAYTETSNTSGDNLRLRVAQDDINSLVGKVGVKYHNVTDKGTPMISLSLNNEFGDDTINSTNTYQGGGSSFTTSTDVEPLSATLGLGYSYGSDTASIEFAYEAEANDDKYLGHYGSIKIVGKF